MSTVSTVEQLWAIYCHLKRAEELPVISDYHLFPENIKPMWEDENNVNGGKLMIRLRKGVSSRIWEDLILSVVGGKDLEDDENEICGLVISIRYHEDIISIWNRNSSPENVNALR